MLNGLTDAWCTYPRPEALTGMNARPLGSDLALLLFSGVITRCVWIGIGMQKLGCLFWFSFSFFPIFILFLFLFSLCPASSLSLPAAPMYRAHLRREWLRAMETGRWRVHVPHNAYCLMFSPSDCVFCLEASD